MTDFLMPRFTDQMEEGTIVKWLIDDGQPVAVGDEVAEIETDKATQACVAEYEGMLEIIAAEGETVAVGHLIARIGSGVPLPATGSAPARATEPGPATDDGAQVDERVPAAVAAGAPAVEANGGLPPVNRGGTITTPLARRIARVHDIALEAVTGTGPRGRITRADVMRAAGIQRAPQAVPGPAASAATPTSTVAAAPATTGTRLQPPTRLQQVIARRMTEQAAVPVFQVQTDVQMDAALALRTELKDLAGSDPAPSVNDLIVRACALALRDHPLVNGSYQQTGFLLNDHINIGIAVATDEGLVVATIPDTDTKSLGQIAREARTLAGRVRDGKATPAELTGGTFTVSNLGMFGMTQITAVINPPQAAILGVGATRPVLARGADGDVVDRQLLSLNLSCDHRILNGADGSRFLSEVKNLLETPLRMAL
ncbi:MAG: catalytic domain of component of various dehydrogenase complexe [Solirubrobacterales bacterium]|nr:catalytic domain of component of various dehydrogenase complexe [Solirubrobacterales bacterium]